MGKNGLHHVTAIAGPAARNAAFYEGTLGLRRVKKTVNFDDPGTYHLYYGDEIGTPGTILTFFPWAHVARGRLGIGETQEIGLRVAEGAIGYWLHRFVDKGVSHDAPEKRFGQSVLPFRDPDGMRLALVAVPGIEGEAAWHTADIPADHAIRGFHGISLLLDDAGPTAAILNDVLGFAETAREGTLIRFVQPNVTMGNVIDLRAAGGFLPARMGAGSVHHVAFRAADDAEQAALVRRLADHHGIATTEQRDRHYFRSVYFREPGGILFEIATDQPGFAVDEPVTALGQALKLPAFLEPRRAQIETALEEIA